MNRTGREIYKGKSVYKCRIGFYGKTPIVPQIGNVPVNQ